MSDYDVIVVGAGSPGEHCAGALAAPGARPGQPGAERLDLKVTRITPALRHDY